MSLEEIRGILIPIRFAAGAKLGETSVALVQAWGLCTCTSPAIFKCRRTVHAHTMVDSRPKESR